MRNTIAVMTSELPQRKVFCVRIVKCDYLWSRDYERICVHGGVSYDWVSVLLNLSATEGRAEPRKERLVWPPLLMIDSQVQWSIIPPSYYVFSFIQPTIYLPCSRTRDWFLNLRVISKVCGCCLVWFCTFSNFYRLDALNATCVAQMGYQQLLG